MTAPGTPSERAAAGKAARAAVPAMAEFADVYADQSERDYESLRAAVDGGRVEAKEPSK